MKKLLLIAFLGLSASANAQPISARATNLFQDLAKYAGMTPIQCPGSLGGEATVCATNAAEKLAMQAKVEGWPRWKRTHPWQSDGTAFTTDGVDMLVVSVFKNIGASGSLLLFTEFPSKKATVAPPATTVKFSSCAAARAAGYSNMRRGQPGYSSNLDRDNDGIACDR